MTWNSGSSAGPPPSTAIGGSGGPPPASSGNLRGQRPAFAQRLCVRRLQPNRPSGPCGHTTVQRLRAGIEPCRQSGPSDIRRTEQCAAGNRPGSAAGTRSTHDIRLLRINSPSSCARARNGCTSASAHAPGYQSRRGNRLGHNLFGRAGGSRPLSRSTRWPIADIRLRHPATRPDDFGAHCSLQSSVDPVRIFSCLTSFGPCQPIVRSGRTRAAGRSSADRWSAGTPGSGWHRRASCRRGRGRSRLRCGLRASHR